MKQLTLTTTNYFSFKLHEIRSKTIISNKIMPNTITSDQSMFVLLVSDLMCRLNHSVHHALAHYCRHATAQVTDVFKHTVQKATPSSHTCEPSTSHSCLLGIYMQQLSLISIADQIERYRTGVNAAGIYPKPSITKQASKLVSIYVYSVLHTSLFPCMNINTKHEHISFFLWQSKLCHKDTEAS